MNTMTQPSSEQAAISLLIVDDDRSIRDLLSRSLANHGYQVETASNVREMEAALSEHKIDLVILDIMMPGEDGLSACRRMASVGGPPIIFLSALGDETDRILGLETGASHYLPKPCSPREILATVRAALRHHEDIPSLAERQAYLFDSWKIDFTSHELLDPDGVLVDLTDGEFAVLRVFVERPRRVLSRDALLEAARGPDTPSFDRAIDVQVSRLRRKLRAAEGELIRTIRNEGYIFAPQVVRV
jgi:two-component system OmpR family response regulator